MITFEPRGVDRTTNQITDQRLYDQDKADFASAIDYLKKNSPTARAELEKLENDPINHKVSAGDYHRTRWENHSVQWAPRGAVEYGKQSISPALALYHELAGHENVTKEQLKEFTEKNKRWDAPTDKFGPAAEHERHAVIDVENPVAKEINTATGKTPEHGGEAIRDRNFYATGNSPTASIVGVACSTCNIPEQ